VRNPLFLVFVLLLLAAPTATAQQGAAPAAGPQSKTSQEITKPLTFDVISVKPNPSGLPDAQMRMNPDGFAATNIQIHVLLLQAFQLHEEQLVGDPKWASNDRWDIDARIAAEDMSALKSLDFHQQLGMFQAILVERFGLKVHHETRELTVYALVVANGGPKMTPSTLRPSDSAGIQGEPGVLHPGRGKETGRGTTMEFLARDLSLQLGRKVVDRTGLAGRYDFTLTWTPDDSVAVTGGGVESGATQGPSLFTAVQEQLGLKLELVKAPVDVVVIDHIEKPSEN
jgi:uncharacterized protein (TIGR03435 family)